MVWWQWVLVGVAAWVVASALLIAVLAAMSGGLNRIRDIRRE